MRLLALIVPLVVVSCQAQESDTTSPSNQTQIDWKMMLKEGATVVDVRTPGEFAGGHVEGSINIPLNEVTGRIEEIKALGKPIVLCCVSGARSGQAMHILRAHGVECSNAGGWMDVQQELRR